MTIPESRQMTNSLGSPISVSADRPAGEVEIGNERIGLRCLMRAVNRMQEEYLETEHHFDDEDSEEWRAVRVQGSPNNREFRTVAEAPTLVSLLRKLGAK